MAREEFKIIKDGMDKYQISIGLGKIFRAENLKEVNTALKHYFENGCFKAKDSKKQKKICPLCRE